MARITALLLLLPGVIVDAVRLARRGVTADNPTGVYISYNLGWHNPATGNFGGNLTLSELAPGSTPTAYSLKLFFAHPETLVQDYWGDYRITHYQSGAYHIQPGPSSAPPNATRVYQFNAVYSLSANASAAYAMLGAASLLHGPNYNDRETAFQRDDVRTVDPSSDLPTAPFGPYVRASGMRNAPVNSNSSNAPPSSSSAGMSMPMIAGIAGAAIALIAIIAVAVLLVRRKKRSAAGGVGQAKQPADFARSTSSANKKQGWSAMDSAGSQATAIGSPVPTNGPKSPGGIAEISGPVPVSMSAGAAASLATAAAAAAAGNAGHHPQQQQQQYYYQHNQQHQQQPPSPHYNNPNGGADVADYVMGGGGHDPHAALHTPEQHQLEFVEQYASANYQPNPYRDTMATTAGVDRNGYRDTLPGGGFGIMSDNNAPPVPALPSAHANNAAAEDVDIADMVERYGHASMYPQNTSEPYNYENYPTVPEVPKGYQARDTFFNSPHAGIVSAYGMPPPPMPNGPSSSYNGSSALKQRLEQEEAKLASQQQHLAQMEQVDTSYATPSYADDAAREGKTAGVVRSRSQRAPKSPMRTDPPPEWLGTSASNGGGTELSRSVPGPGYI